MALFEWSDQFSVGVSRIDSQHKKLVDMVNELHDALVSRKGPEVQRRIVSEMVDYSKSHFALEEKYMLKFHFDGYHTHKVEHSVFTTRAEELQKRLDKTGSVLTLELLSFLRDWLQNHILVTDKKYGALFNQHGLH